MITLRKSLLMALSLWFVALVSATHAATGVSCKDWNTKAFFKKASAADVSICLKGEVIVNTWNTSSSTPLHKAAKYSDDPEVIIALVKAGAEVNATTERFTRWFSGRPKGAREETPLHFAGESNKSPEIVAILIAAGANVDTRDFYEETPLHYAAARNKNPAVITAFAEGGADLSARDKQGETPLHDAAEHNKNPEVITALVAAGANLSAQDLFGETPLQIAKKRNPLLLKAFSQEAVANFKKKQMKARAATPKPKKEEKTTSKWQRLEQLLQTARVSCGKWNTATFFKHAAEKDVSHCLESGAKPNARNKYNETPLHMAAKFSKTPAVVAALKKAGADLKARDKKGRTPLHTAAVFSKTPEVVTELIQAGADLNAKDKRGRTPLEFAEKFSRTPAIMAVLKKATPLAKTKTPVDRKKNNRQARATRVSCEKWNTPAFFRRASEADVSRCLKTKKAGARNKYGRTPLHYAAQGETAAIVTTLVKAGANPNASDERGGWTPLHLAAQTGKTPAVVAALIKAGADPGARDKKGRTPLQLAEKFNKTPGVVNALKQAKAVSSPSPKKAARVSCAKWNTPAFFKSAGLSDLSRCLKMKNPNARNQYGRTPLHYAAQGEAPELVAALVKAGAKPNAPDKRGGWTPLHLAAWFSKKPAVAAALLAAGADPAARDKKGKTPWDYAEQNAALKDTAPYWRLNEERFR